MSSSCYQLAFLMYDIRLRSTEIALFFDLSHCLAVICNVSAYVKRRLHGNGRVICSPPLTGLKSDVNNRKKNLQEHTHVYCMRWCRMTTTLQPPRMTSRKLNRLTFPSFVGWGYAAKGFSHRSGRGSTTMANYRTRGPPNEIVTRYMQAVQKHAEYG